MKTPTPEERARSRRQAALALFRDGYIDTPEPSDDELRGAITRILWERVGADGIWVLHDIWCNKGVQPWTQRIIGAIRRMVGRLKGPNQ